MHPILFHFPDWFPLLAGKALHVYGLMIAIGFLAGLGYIKSAARAAKLPEQDVLDLFFCLMVAGIVGSRILYVINSVNDYGSDPFMVFRVWEGGLVFQGGVIACVLVAIWFTRRRQLSFWQVADVFVPALALGHAFGRIGCFFAGCCFGRQCDPDFLLAVHFPHIAGGIAPVGVPLYPVQLFEAGGEILIFLTLLVYQKRKRFTGAVFLLYIGLYAVLRSVVELFRGDSIRGFVIEPYLSRGQFVSLLSLIAVMVLWRYRTRNREN
jgi:phosphatidylglycerol:prolipoprotein diacylglycerol transferase